MHIHADISLIIFLKAETTEHRLNLVLDDLMRDRQAQACL
jgi:hypothetical protein